MSGTARRSIARRPAGRRSCSTCGWRCSRLCAIVFVAVMAALPRRCGARRARRASRGADLDAHPRGRSPAAPRCVGVRSRGVDRAAPRPAGRKRLDRSRACAGCRSTTPCTSTSSAHQWWWEARYEPSDPALAFTTANELHVPVGRPVVVTLHADDVIHSFWVPSLHGKKDLIPGRESTFAFRADRPASYRGQCAEFCGYQHAHMALFVIADEPARLRRMGCGQRQPARRRRTDRAAARQRPRRRTTCAMCHAIGGTPAQGRRAPDLTHVASRQHPRRRARSPTRRRHSRDWIAESAADASPASTCRPMRLPPQDLAAIGRLSGMSALTT